MNTKKAFSFLYLYIPILFSNEVVHHIFFISNKKKSTQKNVEKKNIVKKEKKNIYKFYGRILYLFSFNDRT